MTGPFDESTTKRVEAAFARLNKQGANMFPAHQSLSRALEKSIPERTDTIPLTPTMSSMFSTAAIEMWHRSIHSFLISAALTESSPLWASVTGYYSSHYCMRGFAHLLGYFQLFRRRRLALLRVDNGKQVCQFVKKGAWGGEHGFYWKVVKQHIYFASDPLFSLNKEDDDVSDASHRNLANYSDHLPTFSQFKHTDEGYLRTRVGFISKISFNTPPIPRRDKYPDIESVQVVAYHRIVRFRRLIDEILGGKNRFWNVHRNPPWATEWINFQLTEQASSPASMLG